MNLNALHRRLLQDVLEIGNAFPFVITGGYAVQAHGLVDRLSRDIDVATNSSVPMTSLADHLVGGLAERGWQVRVIGVDPVSARFMVTDPGTGEDCEVDILKEGFNRPPEDTPWGPVLSLDDVIGTKVRALADRGYPRDLVDIHAASKIRSQTELESLGRRCAWDEFSLEGLATRLGSVLWRADEEFSAYGLSEGEIADLRRWAGVVRRHQQAAVRRVLRGRRRRRARMTRRGDGVAGRPAGNGPVVHRYGADPSQFGELSLPDGKPLGTVAVIHGGFWRARYNLSLGRPLAADLAGRGYAAWNLEYRRALAGGGWPGTFEDVAAGIDLLASLPVDTQRVVAVGHSAGGHLAAWAAGRGKLPEGAPGANPKVAVTGVVSQAGVLALADCARERVGDTAALDLMGGGPDEMPEEYRLADPIAAVPLSAPVLCLHSRGDDNVPYSYSERYVAAATAAGGQARLVELSGDHFTLIDPATPDWAAVIAALPGLLAG